MSDCALRVQMQRLVQTRLPLLATTIDDMITAGTAVWVDVGDSVNRKWTSVIYALVPVTDGVHIEDYLITVDQFDDVTVYDETFLPCARGEYPLPNGVPQPGSLSDADRAYHHASFEKQTIHQLLASRDLYSGWSQRADFTPAQRREFLQIAGEATRAIVSRMN